MLDDNPFPLLKPVIPRVCAWCKQPIGVGELKAHRNIPPYGPLCMQSVYATPNKKVKEVTTDGTLQD